MNASQVQHWMHDVRPASGTSQSFEDVPLTPLQYKDQSSATTSVFPHTPLEHEIVASESVWDDSVSPDELCGEQRIASTRFSGSGISEDSETVVDDQGRFSLGSLEGEERSEPVRSIVLRSASGETLFEIPLALDSPFGPELKDKLCDSSEHVNRSNGPAILPVSIPYANVVGYKPRPRVERSEISAHSSIPDFFDIPIPIFPFPAGTSRCKHRDCPIKTAHEQGPYLHEGKLRTRVASIFGSSNPPPGIWLLYDLAAKEGLKSSGDKGSGPVELFVRYHFGQSRAACADGLMNEVEGIGHRGEKRGGKRARFWRVWS